MKRGPKTGWTVGTFVRFKEGGHGSPINCIYEVVSDGAVSELANLERVQEGHEVWMVYGPRGPYCSVDMHLEVCYGPLTPTDVEFLLGDG